MHHPPGYVNVLNHSNDTYGRPGRSRRGVEAGAPQQGHGQVAAASSASPVPRRLRTTSSGG